jgi:peptide/nickel transport system substrate-binding protein
LRNRTLKDFKSQAPQAICEISHVNVPRTMLINPAATPFDNPELRRAMTLSVDRKAFVADRGRGAHRRQHDAAAGRRMGHACRGVADPVEKRRAEARKIMEKLGYGPDKHFPIKVATRNFPRLAGLCGDHDLAREADR